VEDAADLRAVGLALAVISASEKNLAATVAVARANGRSWARIAAVLGCRNKTPGRRGPAKPLASSCGIDLPTLEDLELFLLRAMPLEYSGRGRKATKKDFEHPRLAGAEYARGLALSALFLVRVLSRTRPSGGVVV
jgi:hypothetical protein